VEHPVISTGHRHEYLALSHLHYRGGLPAMIARVLAARVQGELAGVLVVTWPVLNASWRPEAWPGERWSDRNLAARFVNRHVRRIARVVVEPRLRGLGIASALVRAYLAEPLTRCTEVVSSMAHATPLFERCGMRRVESREPARTAALRRALERLSLSPWQLMDAAELERMLDHEPALERAMRAWSMGSRHSRIAFRSREDLVRASLYAASQVAWPTCVCVSP